MILVLVPNLAQDYIHGLILVLVPIKGCQLKSKSQELKPPNLTLQTRNLQNIG